jgi:hypothetical protein
MAARREFRRPQFFAGLCVVSMESVIVRCTDEDQSARRGNTSAEILRSALQPKSNIEPSPASKPVAKSQASKPLLDTFTQPNQQPLKIQFLPREPKQ